MGNYPKKQQGDKPKSTKEYANGVFVSLQAGTYGEYFSMGINVESFIKELQALTPNEKGMVNFYMAPQKSNPHKYSVYRLVRDEDEQPSSAPQKASQKLIDQTDDLPF